MFLWKINRVLQTVCRSWGCWIGWIQIIRFDTAEDEMSQIRCWSSWRCWWISRDSLTNTVGTSIGLRSAPEAFSYAFAQLRLQEDQVLDAAHVLHEFNPSYYWLLKEQLKMNTTFQKRHHAHQTETIRIVVILAHVGSFSAVSVLSVPCRYQCLQVTLYFGAFSEIYCIIRFVVCNSFLKFHNYRYFHFEVLWFFFGL